MGEIAEMVSEGILCQNCGQWTGNEEEAGHPVSCASCLEQESDAEETDQE